MSELSVDVLNSLALASNELRMPESFDDLHWNSFHRVIGEAGIGMAAESSSLDGRTLFRRLKMQVPIYYLKKSIMKRRIP